jgi:hypothetical protein
LYFLRAEHGDVPRGSKFVFCNVHLQAFAGFPCTIPKTPCRTDAEAGASFFFTCTLPYSSVLPHLCIESRFCVTSDMLEFALRADCGQCASIYAARSSPWHSSLRTHICALVLSVRVHGASVISGLAQFFCDGDAFFFRSRRLFRTHNSRDVASLSRSLDRCEQSQLNFQLTFVSFMAGLNSCFTSPEVNLVYLVEMYLVLQPPVSCFEHQCCLGGLTEMQLKHSGAWIPAQKRNYSIPLQTRAPDAFSETHLRALLAAKYVLGRDDQTETQSNTYKHQFSKTLPTLYRSTCRDDLSPKITTG